MTILLFVGYAAFAYTVGVLIGYHIGWKSACRVADQITLNVPVKK